MDFSKARRGRDAMEESARQQEESKSSFKPFAPTINWQEEGEEFFVAFLTDIDSIFKVLEHRFIPIGTYERGEGKDKETKTRYGFYISRKDPIIGEEHDPLEDDLDRAPTERYLIPAVKLDAVYGEGRGGRKRPVSFEVLTDTYNRRIDPEDEDSETEEITYPVIGLVDQAWGNFVTFLNSHAESDGPIEDVAFRVKRIGSRTDTTYQFTPFPDQEIDYSNLFEFVDGISYLSDDEKSFDELVERYGEQVESDADGAEAAAALTIGEALVHERLEELCDKDKYVADVSDLTPDDVASKFGGKDKKKGGGSKSKGSSKGRGRAKKDSGSEDKGGEKEKSSGGADKRKFQEVKKRAAERRAAREAAAKE